MGVIRNVKKMEVISTEEKIPFHKPRSRWEDNIKVDVKEVEC
jgi:hypothetical protein